MAVLQRILSFIWGILLVAGKLLCLTVRLVLSLFLLVLQLVLRKVIDCMPHTLWLTSLAEHVLRVPYRLTN